MKLLSSDPNNRPSITLPQVVALVPVLLNALAVYGIFTPSPEQSDALLKLLFASAALIGGDAIVRAARNIADGIKTRPKVIAPGGTAVLPEGVTLTKLPDPVIRLHAQDINKLAEMVATAAKPKPRSRSKPKPA